MKPETQIKRLKKEIKELESILRNKSYEICIKNVEIAELEKKLCLALGFIDMLGKK